MATNKGYDEMRILFYPVFTDKSKLLDHYYRAHWYLTPFKESIDEIIILHKLGDDYDERMMGNVPEYLDARLSRFKGTLPIKFLDVNCNRNLKTIVSKANVVLVHESDKSQPSNLPLSLFQEIIKNKKLVRIDHERERFAGSFYLKFSELFPSKIMQDIETSQRVFDRINHRCKSDIGYIFGTGPSLSYAENYDFSDGFCIACNSMVRNQVLLDKLQPPLIVVGDPIFHAGASSYAAAFREMLVQAMDRYASYLVVPMRDFHIYSTYLPERLRSRVAGLPFRSGSLPNLNFKNSFHVTTTGNILTLFLLPLAAQFFNKTKIFGCDGRPLGENQYFWGHHKASQFNDEMGNIQKAHPAFFSIDYDEYYQTHIDTLETWIETAEKEGGVYLNMSPTFIPALLERSISGIGEPKKEKKVSLKNNSFEVQVKNQSTVSIIMPAYNAEGFIEEAIKSVVFQDITDWELIIIDDNSTDKTFEIVSRLKANDSRIKLLKNTGKKGVSAARNIGLKNASGNYVGFLDADDSYEPNALKSRLEVLLNNPHLSLVHGPTKLIDGKGQYLGWTLQLNSKMTYLNMTGNPAHLNSVLGKSKLLKQFRFEEGVTNGEDWWYLARVLRSGVVSEFVEGGGATYRIHSESTVLKNMEKHEDSLKNVIEWLYSKVTEPNVATEYYSGLFSPPKSVLLHRRIYNLLLWNIFQSNSVEILKIIEKRLPKNWIDEQPDAWLSNSIEVTAIRYFGVPVSKLSLLPSDVKKGICETISKCQLNAISPKFVKIFVAKFSLDKIGDQIIGNCYDRNDNALIDETDFIFEISSHSSGMTMIDVGAHFGGSSYKFALKDWNIYAFEPDPENRKKFIDKLGHKKNVHLDIRAVGEYEEKRQQFYSSTESTGISGMLAFRDTHEKTATVDVTTIENVLKEHNISHINFLKIDVEGYDFSVLKGVPWERIKPDIIECEFEDEKTKLLGHGWGDICEFLQEKSYTVYVSEWHPIVRYGIRHDWRCLKRYPCQLEDEKAWGNLLAFRDDPGEENIKTALKKVLKINNKNNPKASEAKADIRHKSQALHSPSKIDILKGENGQLNVKLANNLYRDGDFEASMEANLNLYKKNGLKMYADNALMCAKKIKIPNVETVEQLISLREKQ